MSLKLSTHRTPKVEYLPPSPEPDDPDDCIIITCSGSSGDPIHLPTPDSSPSKDQDSQSDRTDADSESSCTSAVTKIKCSCRIEDRDTPSPKPSSAKVAKDSAAPTEAAQPSALDSLKPPPAAAAAKSKGKGRRGKRKPKSDSAASDKSSKAEAKSKSKSDAKPKVKEEKQDEGMHQKVLTDFFPVRRSHRTPSSVIKQQQEEDLRHEILSKSEAGLKIVEFEGKGRGVVATRDFKRGDFVVEYAGDLIDRKTAKSREEKYKKNSKIGCYMYYFSHKNMNYCVDATAESGRLGRLLNHSRNGNCTTKVLDIDGRPYLLLIADQDIAEGEELLYDYGDRNKEALEAHPWLAL